MVRSKIRASQIYDVDVLTEAEFTTASGHIVDQITAASGTLQTQLADLSYINTDVTKEPTGFVNRTDTALYWDDATTTFTVSGTSWEMYSSGTKLTKSAPETLVGDGTDFTIASGTWFFYYTSGGVLTASQTPWSYTNDDIFTAILYWDGAKGVIGEERHGTIMDRDTHSYLHQTVSSRYNDGLTATISGVYFTLDAGYTNDEDIRHSFGTEDQCIVWYRKPDQHFTFNGPQADYCVDSVDIVQYDNNGVLTDVPNGQHMAYWLIASNTPTENHKIWSIMGQRVDVALQDAKDNNASFNDMILTGLPITEVVVLYRIILRRAGTSISVEDVTDYRSVSVLPTSSYVATDHGVLSGLSDNDHPQYALDTKVDTTSGTLQTQVTTNAGNITTLDTKIDTTSGTLQTQIDGLGGGHTQGTDTTLGTMTADIDMNNSYQIVNLQAPAALGEAIRQTTNVTESNLNELTGGGDTTLHDHDGISENTTARHAESHTITSHSDVTDATGAQLEELTGGTNTTLHGHASVATVTDAAQSAITSLGNLTSLTVAGATSLGDTTGNDALTLNGYITDGASNATVSFQVNDNLDKLYTDLTDAKINGWQIKLSDAGGVSEFEIVNSTSNAVFTLSSNGKITDAEWNGSNIADGYISSASSWNSAAAASHTQGTDTTLGTLTADINMGSSYQLTNLAAPVGTGEAVRTTTNVTEANLNELTGAGDTTLHDHDGISENSTHRGGDGSDHADVATNTSDIATLDTKVDTTSGTLQGYVDDIEDKTDRTYQSYPLTSDLEAGTLVKLIDDSGTTKISPLLIDQVESTGSEQAVATPGVSITYVRCLYVPSVNRYVFTYMITGGVIYYRVGTYNPTTQTMTFGAAGATTGQTHSTNDFYSLLYDPTNDVVIMIFADYGADSYGNIIAGDIQGDLTTITWQHKTVVRSQGTLYGCMGVYNSVDDSFLVIQLETYASSDTYTPVGVTYNGSAFTVEGTDSITVSTGSISPNQGVGLVDLLDGYVAVSCEFNSNSMALSLVKSVAGVPDTIGTDEFTYTSIYNCGPISWDSVFEKIIHIHTATSPSTATFATSYNYTAGTSFSASGESPVAASLGTVGYQGLSAPCSELYYHEASGRHVYASLCIAPYNRYAVVDEVTVDADGVCSWDGSTYVGSAETHNCVTLGGLNTVDNHVQLLLCDNSGYDFTTIGYVPAYSSFVPDGYDGILQVSGTTGQIKQMAKFGEVSNVHSGLTVGSDYFIQSSGTIGTTETAYSVGNAISPTEILVSRVKKDHQADTDIHYLQDAIYIEANQVTDFDLEVGNNPTVSGNTASITTLDSKVDTTSGTLQSGIDGIHGVNDANSSSEPVGTTATHAALTNTHGATDIADVSDIAVDGNLSSAAQAVVTAGPCDTDSNLSAAAQAAITASHAESHNVASHSDTTATGPELDELTDGSETSLHTHAGGSADSVVHAIAQASHGLSVGDVIRYNGSAYVKAQANSAANAEAVGIVSVVTDSGNFEYVSSGAISTLSGLTAGSVYQLSVDTAGLLDASISFSNGDIIKTMLVATSTTAGNVVNYMGIEDGQASGYVGENTIITVGTISTGTWEGTPISSTYMTAASDSVAGAVELATIAETNTGTSTTLAVTPDGLDGWIGSAQVDTLNATQASITSVPNLATVGTLTSGNADSVITRTASCYCIDALADTEVKTGVHYLSIPAALAGFNLSSVHAEVITAGTTGVTTIDVNKNGTSMLSTKITIDTGETGSDTAATAAVIDTAADNVAAYDVISIDIDVINTTPAKGLIVTLEFTKP